MSWLTPEARVLLGKEVRQLLRSRGALLTTTLLPTFLLLVIPLVQLMSARAAEGRPRPATNLPMPSGFGDLAHPMQLFLHLTLPLFIVIGGLLVPSLGTSYTIVVERERRTLELLMALPVRVADILTAKLGAILLMAIVIVVPLFGILGANLLITGTTTPGYVSLLFILLMASLACSIGIALLVTLVAKDFRTANNVNGVFIVPLVLLTIGVLAGVPGDWRLLVLAVLLFGLAAAAVLVAVRWLTFERYLP
jgi:ABC-2 type transport system permease protein